MKSSRMPKARSWPPLVMGIVNVTPDSFSDGGHYFDVGAARDHALALVAEGAGIIDVGGESTRPGSVPVSADEEAARVLPVIEAIREKSQIAVSVDTTKPAVVRAAVAAGADMWNDVSALSGDAESVQTAADLAVPVVLMHKKGDSATMQENPWYDDVVAEVMAYLAGRIEVAVAAGVAREQIWVDPGIGFGKRLADNRALLQAVPRLAELSDGRLLVGVSRKRFVHMLDESAVAAYDTRLGGSLAAALHAARAGAGMLRVHDVYATRQALTVARWLRSGEEARDTA